MNIHGRFHLRDEVSGLELTVIEGEHLHRLRIEFFKDPIVSNREFWFTPDGQFDGTG